MLLSLATPLQSRDGKRGDVLLTVIQPVIYTWGHKTWRKLKLTVYFDHTPLLATFEFMGPNGQGEVEGQLQLSHSAVEE